MTSGSHYGGQRLSLKAQCCTVYYIGNVSGKAGEWLGVEWDDISRGKHSGTFEGQQYFHCLSKSPTAASFLRPTQPWDQPRTFLQALTEKYMSTGTHDAGAEIVYISGKQAEEVGFSKFSQRQAKLQGIHVLVLDNMRIKHTVPLGDEDKGAISELCADITVLDLSSNLFEHFSEIVDLCSLFPKLHTLTLSRNRFNIKEDDYGFLPTVRNLTLSRTLMGDSAYKPFFSVFALDTLDYSDNEITYYHTVFLPDTLTALDFSGNELTGLSDVQDVEDICPDLQVLELKHNKISGRGMDDLPENIRELGLAHNAIDSWSFFDLLRDFKNLRNLRLTGNPLYQNLVSAEGRPLTLEDGYMLTVARLPQIEMLNYTKISDKERLNAETYYLGQIAVELGRANGDAAAEAEVLARHPRYKELCEEYGEPVVQRGAKVEEVDPRSLAARLVKVEFELAQGVLPGISQRSWREEVPKSFDVYAVLGLVGKRLGVAPFNIGLTLETGERDPTLRDSGYGGPEWWDSDDEEVDTASTRDEDWTTRDIELVPGTRALATYVEGREAKVKVRLVSSDG